MYFLFGRMKKIFSFRQIFEDRGSILALSLILLVVMTLLGLGAVAVTHIETESASKYKGDREAFYIAEAGVERAKTALKGITFDDALDGADNDKGNVNDNGILSFGSSVSFAGGTYAAVVTDNDDGDGDVWDDSDSRVVITSTGVSPNGRKRTIEVLFQKISLGELPAAMSFVDPDVKLEFLSGALSVTGNDTVYDPGPPERTISGSGPDKHGIATESMAPTTTYSPVSSANNITGVGGVTPDIDTSNADQDLADLQAARSSLISMSGITTYSGSTEINGGTIGTRDNPQITYVNDSLDIKGNVTGAGILIVDNDFIISGNLVFEGIILVGICPTCPGRVETGTGNSKVFGAFVVANPTSSHSNEARLKMRGNADIYYSSFAITNALKGTGGAVSWREVF